MSAVLSSKDGIKARKPHSCVFCQERINVGDTQDVRTGAGDDGMWTMHMHPECHRYEQKKPSPVDWEWYEDGFEAAFGRAEAIAYVASLTPTNPANSTTGAPNHE